MLCLVRRRRGGGWMLWMGTFSNRMFGIGVRDVLELISLELISRVISVNSRQMKLGFLYVYIFACRPEFTLQAKKEISRLVLVYE